MQDWIAGSMAVLGTRCEVVLVLGERGRPRPCPPPCPPDRTPRLDQLAPAGPASSGPVAVPLVHAGVGHIVVRHLRVQHRVGRGLCERPGFLVGPLSSPSSGQPARSPAPARPQDGHARGVPACATPPRSGTPRWHPPSARPIARVPSRDHPFGIAGEANLGVDDLVDRFVPPLRSAYSAAAHVPAEPDRRIAPDQPAPACSTTRRRARRRRSTRRSTVSAIDRSMSEPRSEVADRLGPVARPSRHGPRAR